jgi:hypothetical protein
MQHQLAIAAEKPGRVDAERQIAFDTSLGAVRDHGLGITVDPPAFHGSMIRKSGYRFSEKIMLHQTTATVSSAAGDAA